MRYSTDNSEDVTIEISRLKSASELKRVIAMSSFDQQVYKSNVLIDRPREGNLELIVLLQLWTRG
jgi:hypothetical protein